MSAKSRIQWYSLCGIFLLLVDQLLKYFARTNQSFTYYIFDNWLGWEYLGNTGIAFSLPIPNLLLVFVSPLIILGFFVLLTKHYKKKYLALGLILIVFGAISNYIDRVLFALTIDYIKVFTAVFNLADVMVVGGALVLLLTQREKSAKQPSV